MVPVTIASGTVAGALACWLLSGVVVGAAERAEQPTAERAGAEARTAECPEQAQAEQAQAEQAQAERAQELRRQLLEHNRRWRGGPVFRTAPSMPGLSGSPSAVVESISKTIGESIGPSGTPHGAAAALPATVTLPFSGPPMPAPVQARPGGDSGSGSDFRLSERERNLLRQQLRQVPRLPAPRRDQ